MNPLEWPWWVQLAAGWGTCTIFVLMAFAVEFVYNKECMEFCSRGGNANAFRHKQEGLTMTLFVVGLAVFLLGSLGMLSKLLS